MSAGVRDVVVAGGGPAGSATAVFLRQRGYDVLLVDAARFPRDKVCGDSVSPEGWRLLEAMGAAGAVRDLEPHPLHGMRLTAPDGTRFQGDYGGDRHGLGLRRARLDQALLQRARDAGVEVREGVIVDDIVRHDGHVEGLRIRPVDAPPGSAEHCLARAVVGAEGRRSVVARRLGLLREHRRFRKFAVRGYWQGMDGLDTYGEMHVAGAGYYCGIAPLSARTGNVAFVLDRGEMMPAGGDLEDFYRRTLRARWPHLAERLERATLCGPPRAIGPLALSAPRVWAPGVVLVGDAAGFYDPFTGEGVTLALRGAELAAEAIDAALRTGTARDLSAYQRARDASTRAKFRFNHLLQYVVGRPWLANHVARRLARRPDLASRLVGIAGDFVPARQAFGARFVLDLLTA